MLELSVKSYISYYKSGDEGHHNNGNFWKFPNILSGPTLNDASYHCERVLVSPNGHGDYMFDMKTTW